jgi:hypothetical protein
MLKIGFLDKKQVRFDFLATTMVTGIYVSRQHAVGNAFSAYSFF